MNTRSNDHMIRGLLDQFERTDRFGLGIIVWGRFEGTKVVELHHGDPPAGKEWFSLGCLSAILARGLGL